MSAPLARLGSAGPAARLGSAPAGGARWFLEVARSDSIAESARGRGPAGRAVPRGVYAIVSEGSTSSTGSTGHRGRRGGRKAQLSHELTNELPASKPEPTAAALPEGPARRGPLRWLRGATPAPPRAACQLVKALRPAFRGASHGGLTAGPAPSRPSPSRSPAEARRMRGDREDSWFAFTTSGPPGTGSTPHPAPPRPRGPL